MSSSHADHHHGAGGDHVPHVLPLKTYFGVFSMLLVFTVLTVAVSYVDLGAANLFVAMFVATCKALMVGAIFMHLAFDRKFNVIVFATSVLFLGVFIAFVMFDTEARGIGNRSVGDRPALVDDPFSGTKQEAAMKARWTPAETSPAAPEAPAGQHDSGH